MYTPLHPIRSQIPLRWGIFQKHNLIRTMQDNQKSTSTTDLQDEVAKLMVECLNLEVAANQIPPDAPLYGDGLGLDSIDVLEVALVVSKRYGLQLRTDGADNQHIFSSLRSLCDYIAAHRTL
jgi:acyl carrier protein